MLKKWTILSLAVLLLGGFSFSGAAAPPAKNATKTSQTSPDLKPSLPEAVQITPEMRSFAKKHGIDPKKHDPAYQLKMNRGKKFAPPGDDRVTYQPTKSKIPMLVIMVEFPDTALGAPEKRVPAKYFQNLIFGETYNPYELELFDQYATYHGVKAPTDRTMQNAYAESSYGKVELITYDDLTDVGWVTLPKGASYYLDQTGFKYGNEHGYARIGEMLTAALKIADEKIDFSKYAVDGKVPNVFFIHEGSGAEWSLDPRQIWSHKWGLLSALYFGDWYETGYYAPDTNEDGTVSAEEWSLWYENFLQNHTFDGVLVNHYTIEPEIGGNVAGYNAATGEYDESYVTGPYPATVGVFAHEFGHALGLPDFYDTDYSSEGVGNFSLMAGGSWMAYPAATPYLGNSPTHFDPFSKIFLGWVDPIEVTPEDGKRTITLQPVNEQPDIVKMVVPGSNGTEYFLFENVQQEGFNKGLGRMGEDAHGLVAWHVDENIIRLYQEGKARANNVENWMNKRFQYNQKVVLPDGTEITHYGLSVLQADGDYDLEHGVNRGDAADFFKTGDEITPNSKNVHTGSYYFWRENAPVPAYTGIHVTNITKNKDGSITATFFYEFPSDK